MSLTLETINRGTVANDGTGDTLYVAAGKLNNNFTAINAGLDAKLDVSAYNQHFKGVHASLSALETAHPTASAGDYAQVDAGTGSNLVTYSYDLQDGWVLSNASGSGAVNTDGLPEGSTNLYFTNSRAVDAVYPPANDIVAGTKTKITYNEHGVITSANDATTADIADSTNKRYVTDAEKTVLSNTSGTNTGDETTSTIKSKLGISTLSGSNTGDQTINADGAWTSWTPTFTNITVGNGTLAAKYKKLGDKTVIFRMCLTLGSTSSVGVSPFFTLPFTTVNTQPVSFGSGGINDASAAATYQACLILKSAAEAFIGLNYVTGTNVGVKGLTSAIPITFASGDIIYVEGIIEI